MGRPHRGGGGAGAQRAYEHIHDALYKATGIPGNAAAIREALNRVGHLANDLRNITERDTEVRADVNEIVDVCRAALTSPARNCDQFATAEEAYSAWQKHNSLTAICDWLFATAQEGKEATMPSPTPTPPGTPTKVFVRFVAERPEGVECQIGCDGEESAPPNTRQIDRNTAAIAAPTRNCDRFATAEDAFKAWESDNKKPPEQCFLQWLFATAEGGDHA